MNRDYQRAYLAAIKNQPEYWKRHYASNVTGDGGTLRDSPLLGAELIPDASRWFSIDKDPYWSRGSGWSISGGVALHSTSTAGVMSRLNILNVGSKYSITFSIVKNNGIIGINGSTIVGGYYPSSSGTYTVILTSLSTDLAFYSNGDNNTIDNISIREVLQPSMTKAYYKMARENNIAKSIQFAWLGEGGSKFRTSGIYSYFTKIYSMLGGNDAVQATSTNQPFLSGNIAPNEKYGLKNPNGASTFMTHPTISFLATDKWTVSIMFNWNDSSNSYTQMLGNGTNSAIGLKFNNGYRPYFSNVTGGQTAMFPGILTAGNYIGKNVLLTVTADGAGNISFYLNGVLKETKPATGGTAFSPINTNYSSVGLAFFGKQYYISLRSQTLTQSQITAEYNLSQSYIPEIENVTIGTQTWATSNCEMAATPQGNIIPEVQSAGNVERVVNPQLSTNIVGYAGVGNHTITYSSDNDGVCLVSSSGVGAALTNCLRYSNQVIVNTTINNFCKITIKAKSISGNTLFSTYLDILGGGLGSKTLTTEWQTFVFFGKIKTNTIANSFLYIAGAGEFAVDSFSIQEVGWSGSQELYDGIYAQTSGTVEQKTYAAVKAAAMWCHYNNDVTLGAVYGKLYNWFAVKLIQMDIDYYNAANPTASWGWRVPTQIDFTTLSTYLGGNDVSGGKLKKEGTTYWSTPNTGADNSSGFSAIGGGSISSLGAFASILTRTSLWTTTGTTFSTMIELRNEDSAFYTFTGQTLITGRTIRLIKQ